MNSCELVSAITAAACAVAKDRCLDDIELMAAIFSQLGDTLATIAVKKASCDCEDAD